jgi:hypothetical protein
MKAIRLLSGLILGASLLACGGSPAAPTADQAPGDVVVRGTVQGAGLAAGTSGRSTSVSSGALTVSVLEAPAHTSQVGGDGSFALTGLPAGHLTLVFSRTGQRLGILLLEGLTPGAQVTIRVELNASGAVLLEQQSDDPGAPPDAGGRTCIVSGGRVGSSVELEGSVASGSATSFQLRVNGNRSSAAVQVDAAGATFTCLGKGGCAAAVLAGAKVHVSGSLTACDTVSARVEAREVKVQK